MDKHFKLSMLKSFFRVIGFGCLLFTPIAAVVALLVAELLGIAEEF